LIEEWAMRQEAETLPEAKGSADAENSSADSLRALAAATEPAPPPAPAPGPGSLAQDPELLSDFILESREHLATVESQSMVLEQNPSDAEAIHAIFRGFHTIKGLAGFLELASIQETAHEVETLLDRARNGQMRITPKVIDVVLAGADYLRESINGVESSLQGGQPPIVPGGRELVASIRRLLDGEEDALEEPEDPAELAGQPQAVEPPAPGAPTAQAESKAEVKAVKVDTAKLDYLADMAGEMVIAQSLVLHDPDLAGLKSARLVRNLSQLARITSEIQKTSMSMRLVPIAQLFQRMVRLGRDLARKFGKPLQVETAGEETELDRNIVQELADPLMHMVRNAVDHGIEGAADRQASGKPAVARIGLRAWHQAGYIVIEVSDDGHGLDKDRILAKARSRGLSTEHLTENEIYHLIFEPGFSTATQVTDVSGRGVGMDVVRKHIQKLRGRTEIRTVPGQGTVFTLKLPLTLAMIEGLVVKVGADRYILPMFAVREMFRPAAGVVSTVQNRAEMVLVRGRLLPILRLHRQFAVKPRSEDPCQSLLIVAESEGRSFCLMVDELIGKQEVVIKGLGETFRNTPGIAGGAILGDGRVGLILDLDGVYKDRRDD
jgi:two-component system chemotaxis sensor kinase CheA